jgi:hypothetical protein
MIPGSQFISLVPDAVAEHSDLLKEFIEWLAPVGHSIMGRLGEIPGELEKANTYLNLYVDPMSQRITRFDLEPESVRLRILIQQQVDLINASAG